MNTSLVLSKDQIYDFNTTPPPINIFKINSLFPVM